MKEDAEALCEGWVEGRGLGGGREASFLLEQKVEKNIQREFEGIGDFADDRA